MPRMKKLHFAHRSNALAPVDVLPANGHRLKTATAIGDVVRKALNVGICLLLFGVLASAHQRGGESAAPGEGLAGTWSGTWEGAGGTGGFELTLEKAKDGSMGGRVSVTGEPTYKATLGTVSFDGPKMTAKYDFPPDENIIVVLEARFEGNRATGTWAAREKANGGDIATGTWTVTRK